MQDNISFALLAFRASLTTRNRMLRSDVRTVNVLFFELEISNVLIKSFVWHICHEDIFSVTPRTVWPRWYLGRDWLSWIGEFEFWRLLPRNGILPGAKFSSRPPSLALSYWQRYCTALEQWMRAKLCDVQHRAPPISGRATITLGIGPHSSFFLSSSSSFFPRLISAVGDWMSTILLHMAWP